MKQQFRKILSLTTAAVLTLGMVVTAHAADSGMTRGEMAKLLVEGAGLSGQAAVYDLRKTLRAHGDEYIFYRTDHHWTSEGAYLAYEQFAGSKGLPLFDRSAANEKKVENFYGTSYSKARNYDVVPDTITYYDLPNQLTEIGRAHV